MGSIDRRVKALERQKRERAVAKVRAFCHGLSVEEWAMACAAAKALEAGLELTSEEEETFDREQRAEIEQALRVAIGWHEGMSVEEEEDLIGRLFDEIDVFGGRGYAIKRHYEALTAARGEAGGVA